MRWPWLLAGGLWLATGCSGRRSRHHAQDADGGAGQLAAGNDAGGAAGRGVVTDADKAEARAANLRGDRLAADERWTDAVAAYEDAVARDPGLLIAQINLGWALMFEGNLSRARVETLRALEQAGDQVRWIGSATYNLGRIDEAEGKLEDAKSRYRESLRARPHRTVAERLAAIDSAAEREADAALLAILEEPAPDAGSARPGLVPVKTLALALRRLGLESAPVVTRAPGDGGAGAALVIEVSRPGDPDGGTTSSRVLLVELGSAVARVPLAHAEAAMLERRDVTGDTRAELVLHAHNELRIYRIDPRALVEILGLPLHDDGAAYELREVPFGKATDVVAIPFEDSGPSAGRWRYLNDRFRKLEL